MFHSVEYPEGNYLVAQPPSQEFIFDESKMNHPFSSLNMMIHFYNEENKHFVGVESKITYNKGTYTLYGFFPQKYTDSPDSLNDFTELSSVSSQEGTEGFKAVFNVLDNSLLNYTGMGKPLITAEELKNVENNDRKKLGNCNMCDKYTAYFTQYEDETESVYECLWCMMERGGIEVLGEQEQPWSIYVRDSEDEVLPLLL